MGLTETHIKESIIEQAGEYKKKSTVYHNGVEGTNRYTGVKILIEQKLPATFTRVNDRICYAEIQMDKYKVILFIAYAPTLIVSEQNQAQGRFLWNFMWNHQQNKQKYTYDYYHWWF